MFTFPSKEVKDRIEKAKMTNRSLYVNGRDYTGNIDVIYDMAKYAVENGYKTLGGA